MRSMLSRKAAFAAVPLLVLTTALGAATSATGVSEQTAGARENGGTVLTGSKASTLILTNDTDNPIWIFTTEGGLSKSTTEHDEGILSKGESHNMSGSNCKGDPVADVYARIYSVVGPPEYRQRGAMIGFVGANNDAMEYPYILAGAGSMGSEPTPNQVEWSLAQAEGHQGWFVPNTKTKLWIHRDSDTSNIMMKVHIQQLDYSWSYNWRGHGR